MKRTISIFIIILFTFPTLPLFSDESEIEAEWRRVNLARDNISALSQILESSIYWEVRRMAATYLGETQDNQAIDPLIDGLGDMNEEVRVECYLQLGLAYEEDNSILNQKLIQGLSNYNDYIRLFCTTLLGDNQVRAAIPHIIQRLYDDNEDVVVAALDALIVMGYNSASINGIRNLKNTTNNYDIVQACEYALERLTQEE